MSTYDLPTSLCIGEVEYQIRYNWRAILDVLAACNDPELDEPSKALCMLQIIFPDWETIPSDLYPEACEKACEFIDCGQKDDGKPKPKLIDWEQDAPILIPEINKVAGKEVRLEPGIHWWTFFGWFMGIGEGQLSTLVSIRDKLHRGKKLEEWEQRYYRDHKNQVDFEKRYSAEELAEQERLKKLLGE